MQLCESANQLRSDEGQKPLTEKQFLQRIKLNAIVTRAPNKFKYWYSDGNLFGDHAIELRGDLRNGPTKCDTPG